MQARSLTSPLNVATPAVDRAARAVQRSLDQARAWVRSEGRTAAYFIGANLAEASAVGTYLGWGPSEIVLGALVKGLWGNSVYRANRHWIDPMRKLDFKPAAQSAMRTARQLARGTVT